MASFWNRLMPAMNRGFAHLVNSPCEIQHYDICLDLLESDHRIQVTGVAQGKVIGESATELRFLLGLDVISPEISPCIVTKLTLDGVPADYSRDDFLFTVRFLQKLGRGDSFKIGFSYTGSPAANKCWVNSRPDWPFPGLGDGETELCFEGLWLPFANEQFQSPTTTITISGSAGQTILFNGDRCDATNDAKNSVQQFTTAMPTFPTVIGGDFQNVQTRAGNAQISFYYQSGYDETAKKTIAIAGNILTTIAGWIGINPVTDFTLVQLKRTSFGQYAPFPFVILPRDDIRRKVEDNDWSAVTKMLAHEIGHFWFGNLVRSRPDEQWLSEGFAQYINLLVTEYLIGTEALESDIKTYIAQLQEIDLETQPALMDIPLFHPSQFILVRSKGALVLHCLRQECGLSAIKGFLRALVERHQGQTICSDDVECVCRDLGIVEDAKEFFDVHVRGVGTYSWDGGARKVVVSA